MSKTTPTPPIIHGNRRNILILSLMYSVATSKSPLRCSETRGGVDIVLLSIAKVGELLGAESVSSGA